MSIWRHDVVNIDTRPTTYSEEFNILAKDDLNISFKVHVVMYIAPDTVKSVVQVFGGEKWYPRFVREPFRTYVREAVQQYESRSVKHERIATAITQR